MILAVDQPTVREMEADDYHATDDVSCSAAKTFRRSRREFAAVHVLKTQERRAPTRRMDFGTVSHAAILEPHIIDDLIVEISPDVLTSNGQRRGKAWDEFTANLNGKIPFSSGEVRAVRAMQQAAWSHPIAGRLLRAKGPIEQSLFWKCPRSGLSRKARIDKQADQFIVDLKTTDDVSPAAFARVAANLDYDFQAAYYSDAVEQVFGERRHFVFIAQGVNQPYPTRVYKLNADAELAAFQDMERTLMQIAECFDSGDWSEPGENEIVELGMPRWKFSNQWELS